MNLPISRITWLGNSDFRCTLNSHFLHTGAGKQAVLRIHHLTIKTIYLVTLPHGYKYCTIDQMLDMNFPFNKLLYYKIFP